MIKRRIKSIIPAKSAVAQYGYLGFDNDEDKAIPCVTNEFPIICWALMEQDGEQYIVGMTILESGDIDACDNRDDFLGYSQILDGDLIKRSISPEQINEMIKQRRR